MTIAKTRMVGNFQAGSWHIWPLGVWVVSERTVGVSVAAAVGVISPSV